MAFKVNEWLLLRIFLQILNRSNFFNFICALELEKLNMHTFDNISLIGTF